MAALGVNIWLLLRPALQLAEEREREAAMNLFNKASYYPFATLLLVLAAMLF